MRGDAPRSSSSFSGGAVAEVERLFQGRPAAVAFDVGAQIEQLPDRPDVVHPAGRDERVGQLGPMPGQEVDERLEILDRGHGEDQALEERRMADLGPGRREAGILSRSDGEAFGVARGECRLRRSEIVDPRAVSSPGTKV